MSKKKKIPSKESIEITYSIENIIENIIEEKISKLVRNDIKSLAKELMPHVDLMISNKIKEHFYELGNFLTEKFKKSGD